ncbi:MAG: ABC transporter ATP-binding protein [Methylobacterium sp.]|uniref:ABC transporter ATP-binding protein n=1 Tax=Methylobacterium sp. TaxID=409 RepID=UPI0025D44C0F|nr:ABC transporter ATP-binding protein [Methylobacterium sp.]MBX9930337.1 ABC transporter ATP-binding protein [Methylobacterium sp.]
MTVPDHTEGEPLLRIAGLSKRFGAFAALSDVSLDLTAGEFVCLLGPSGCGKSTLLRLVAGFETPTSGTIMLGSEDLAALPPHRRPVNMMFQFYALFPHMSVGRNIAYGLKGMGMGRTAVADRVAELLRLLRLDGFEGRAPDTLSGGQRQRVALARALAREPKVLLLDEPLGALDRSLREETQGELRALQRRLGTSFVVVTHDAGEAMTMADRIAVMNQGRLVQIGDAASLYERPASRFIAGLLGDVNLIEGRIAGPAAGAIQAVETGFGRIEAATERSWGLGEAVAIGIRPERVTLVAGAAALEGRITERTYLGDRLRYRVTMADGTILRASVLSSGHALSPGDPVGVAFAPDAIAILPP